MKLSSRALWYLVIWGSLGGTILSYGQSNTEGKRCLGACTCYDDEFTVDCSGKSYDTVPYDIPADTKVLKLNGNDISRIRAGDFRGLNKLQILDLSSNSISTIQPSSFEDLSALETLKLDYNQMRGVTEEMFVGLDNLLELEMQYQNLNTLPSRAFSPLTNLQKLNLDFNPIFGSSLTNESFSGLSSLTSLSMTGTYVPDIPMISLIPVRNSLKSFTMSYTSPLNGIGGPDRSKIDLPYLEKLNLSYCNIQSILGQSLSGLPRLNDLDLTGNYLLALLPRTFEGIEDLQLLRLKRNPLQTFPYSAFEPISRSLTYLDMSYVSFKDFESMPSGYDESYFSNLTSFVLDSGALETISEDSFFKNAKLLEYLKIAGTKIKDIPTALRHLTGLETLVLSNNPISKVESGDIPILNNLRELEISSSPLSLAEDGLFDGLQLTSLELNDNTLRNISSNAFQNLSELETINLSNNLLETPDEKWFTGKPLQQVFLKGNPWNCDCNADEYRLWTESLEYESIGQIDNVVCEDPRVLRTSVLTSVNPEDLSCETSECPSECVCTSTTATTLAQHSSEIEYLNARLMTEDRLIQTNRRASPLYGIPRKENPVIDDKRRAVKENEVTAADCTGSKLTELPVMPSTTEYLNIATNQITYLRKEDFVHLVDLRIFVASDNEIQQLDNETFSSTIKLEEVYLNKNSISNAIHSELFQGLRVLRILRLDDNMITEIIPLSFSTLESLEFLDLSYNALSTLQSNTFNGLINLEYLDLAHNLISSIDEDSLQDLANLQYLYLAKNSLSKIPPNVILSNQRLTYLDIGENQLGTINDGFLQSQSLEVLKIESGYNPEIKNGSIRLLPNIKVLRLFSGRISNIESEAFMVSSGNGESKITTLDLGNNQIAEVPLLALSVLTNLETLSLNKNNFQELPSWTGNEKELLPNLQTLYLAENGNLASVQDDAFISELKSLRALVINDCSLTSIPVDALRNLSSLSHLIIDGNPITRVSADLSALHELEEIQLSDTRILTSISESAFQSMTKLKRLTLSGGRLRSVPKKEFAELAKIEVLDLSRNQLKYPEKDWFTAFDPAIVKSISLHHNPWVCDCSIEEYKDWIEEGANGLEENFVSMTCESPQIFKGWTVEEVNITNLGCDDKPDECDVCDYDDSTRVYNCSGKELSRVPSSCIPHQTVKLDLSNNEIGEVKSGDFDDLLYLEVLEMQQNRIVSIADDVFVGVGLRYLDISENELTYSSCSWLDGMPAGQLQTLKLSGNRFHCSCEMVGYRDYMDTEKYSLITNAETPVCSSPDQFEGKSLTDIKIVELETTCDNDLNAAPPTYCSERGTTTGLPTTTSRGASFGYSSLSIVVSLTTWCVVAWKPY